MRKFVLTGLALVFVALCEVPAHAALALIINGASATSEPGTTSAITANLNTQLTAAGYTTTTVDGVPVSLAGFSQVWDIRFSNTSPITAGQQAQYLSYLQSGGGMFVMGENSSFATRNNSVLALISAAGGGSLGFVSPASAQTVFAPFTGPNPISGNQITYAAPGGVGVGTPGSGQYISGDTSPTSGSGTGVAWGSGDLTNAPAGTLTVIFDVNFMQNQFDIPDSTNLLKNIIGFIEVETNPNPVPEPATLAIWGMLAGVGGGARLLRRWKAKESR